MYNIKFRGIYENEKQLQKNEILDTSVRFKEPENINKFMQKDTKMVVTKKLIKSCGSPD